MVYCDECEMEIKPGFLQKNPDVMKFRNKSLCRACGERYKESNIKKNSKR